MSNLELIQSELDIAIQEYNDFLDVWENEPSEKNKDEVNRLWDIVNNLITKEENERGTP